MKDSVIALVEAVRLARLELHCFRDPRCAASAEWTIRRLEKLLLDPDVSNWASPRLGQRRPRSCRSKPTRGLKCAS